MSRSESEISSAIFAIFEGAMSGFAIADSVLAHPSKIASSESSSGSRKLALATKTVAEYSAVNTSDKSLGAVLISASVSVTGVCTGAAEILTGTRRRLAVKDLRVKSSLQSISMSQEVSCRLPQT